MLFYLDLTEAGYLENIAVLLTFVDKQNIRSLSFSAIGKKFTKNFMKKVVEAAHELGNQKFTSYSICISVRIIVLQHP